MNREEAQIPWGALEDRVSGAALPLFEIDANPFGLYSFIQGVGEGFYKMPEIFENRLEVAEGWFATLEQSHFYQARYRKNEVG